MGTVSLLILIGAAQQYHQLQALMFKQDARSTPATANPAPQAIDQARIAKLFGAHAAQSAVPPQATNFPLELLGSFVNVAPENSAALIQAEGKPARRVIVGQNVASGVRLAAVSADHVLLERNGVSEHLTFPRTLEHKKVHSREKPEMAYTLLIALHLDSLTEISTKQTRSRNEFLRKELYFP
jgi:type II secretory pathway component PulC